MDSVSVISDRFFDEIIKPVNDSTCTTICVNESTSCDTHSVSSCDSCPSSYKNSSSCYDPTSCKSTTSCEDDTVSVLTECSSCSTEMRPVFNGVEGIPGLPGEPTYNAEMYNTAYVSNDGSDKDYELGDINYPLKTIKKAIFISTSVFVLPGLYDFFKIKTDKHVDAIVSGKPLGTVLEGFEFEG